MSKEQQLTYLQKGSMALLFVLGLFFLLPSTFNIYSSRLLDNHGIIVTGRIDKVTEKSNAEADWLNFEVVFTYAGKQYRILNRVSDMQPIYKLDDAVEVIFFRDIPEEAIINSMREKYSANTIMIIIGLFACIGGSYLFFNTHLFPKLEDSE